jgi:molecular chaperone GrpE
LGQNKRWAAPGPVQGEDAVVEPTEQQEPIEAGSEDDAEQAAGSADETAVEQAEVADAVDSELMDLQFSLGEAERELAEHREAMLRMQAEMENLRKRLIRDLERSRRLALERFMTDLLPVMDSLERGLQAGTDSATVQSLLEGKGLILKMLSKALQEHGLEEVDPLGDVFDPESHEAMTMQPSEEYEENVVMEVLQKGFRLHERLLRPAMVVVSRGSGN